VAGITDESMQPADWKAELQLFVYDKERDARRKRQLEALLSRNFEQIKEEEFLMQEFKRIQNMHKTNREERSKVLKMAQDVLASRPIFVIKTRTFTPKPSRKRKRDDATKSESRSTRTGGNYLRSTRFGGISATRVNAALTELQIPENPLPTARICKAINELKSEVSVLLDLYDQLMKAEHEVQLLRLIRSNSLNDSQSLSTSLSQSINMNMNMEEIPSSSN